MRTGAQAVAFKRVVAFVFCSVTCAPMWAQTDAGESDHQFNTAGQSLTQALKNFAQTTNQQIIFNEDMVAGMTAPALQGQYTPQDALGKLLKGTGLTAEKSPSGALMIKQHATGDSIVLAQGPLRQAQANQGAAAGSPGQGSHPGDERGSPTNTGTDGARSDSEENQPDGMAEVKVTGSRIVQNGYQAPTPVTVATAADLAMGSPTDISDGLRKLPNFVGSSGPNASALFSAAPIRGNVLNLRGLGPNRTLVLLDGVRVPATNYQNTVDVDVLPQLLVERVDIVTGGASASYGSDAVAGVVNYVLDTNFTGLKGVAQGGISTFGDDGNQRFGVAFGTHIGDRGHLIASAEYYNSDGYQMSDRPKLNDSGLAVGSVVGSSSPPGSAANPYVNVQNVRVSFLAPGGYAASGPFGINSANPVYFEAPGLYRPLNFGAPTGTNNVFKYPSDFFTLNDLQAAAAIRNVNLFARASYDLGAETTAYVQVIAAQSKNSTNAVPNEQGFPPDQLFSGNAFLAPALQAMLTSTNTASFQYSKYFNDQPIIRTLERINNYDEAAGIKGKLFGRFTWTLDYAHGTSIDNVAQPGQFNLPYFYAAIDAVVDPATGRTVCYPQLSTDPVIAARYAGCQPFNLFGFGAASKAAVAYTTQGVDQYKAVNTTNDVALNFAGPLVSLPAGPLSASLGFEYRTESLRLTSNGDPANPPDFTGLRGVVLPHQWFLTNQAVTDASENVREEYAELAVPLFKNLPLIKSLDLNGAARLTRYSTTGQARTWKFGATWQAVDDLLIRATRSRDIRAPTLYDLFSGAQTTQASALDPHTGINSGFFSVSSGNPNLQPEVGYTTTVGFSYQPGWLEGFAMSVDYYRIDMTGAVATLTTLALLQDCEASNGTGPSCASILRPLPFSDRSPANTPLQVTLSGINVAKIVTDGVDLDASYKSHVFGGVLTGRGYASYVGKFATQLSAQQPLVDYAGYNAAGSGGVSGAVPQFKGTFSLHYDLQNYGIHLQENIIGPMKLGPKSVAIYVDPDVPANFTTDMTLSYRMPTWGADSQFFLSITNLFNKTPPFVYGTTGPGLNGLSTIPGLYDTTGRMFVAGVRFSM